MATNEVKSDSNAKILIHTGNILGVNEILRKAGKSPAEELSAILKLTFDKIIDSPTEGPLVEIRRNNLTDESLKLKDEDRKDLKVIVKVFLCGLDNAQHDIEAAIQAVLQELGTDTIENVVLSVPLWNDQKVGLNDLTSAWDCLSKLVRQQKVTTLGISDIETDVFVELYNWAQEKPSIVQINLATCCVVPAELSSFAKENRVQLLTHSDPLELLPHSTLTSCVNGKAGSTLDNLQPSWIARYQVHVKCRGILTHKGYIVCASS